MPSNYDNSAWFYDRLSTLIYGKTLVLAQTFLLQYLPENGSVLIAGGGTGRILEEITKIRPSGLNITYVEISAKMMAHSRKRFVGDNQVSYVNKPVEDVNADEQYDVVITPFLLDNFTEQTLQKVFIHIHRGLRPGGLWLNTDFKLTGKWWQAFLLRSMLLFFRIICGIESQVLPDIEKHFELHQYKNVSRKPFFGEFILSTAYQKP